MKKYLTGKTPIVACLLMSGMLTGCSKEVEVNDSLNSLQQSHLLQKTEQVTVDTSAMLQFLKGPFISQANTTTRTDSSVMIFDFTLKKHFTRGAANQLSIAYGDPQFVERGWKYEIAINFATGYIQLSPNGEMEAAIVPGSFKTIAASFNRSTQNFEFITTFKELNGNKSEVAETIFPR